MLAILAFASACGGTTSSESGASDIVGSSSTRSERSNSADIAAAAVVGTYDPVAAGEPLPTGFRQLLQRDAILPVYAPTFVSAGEIDWAGDSLVIGVDLEGEARAYPIGFLGSREMVVDNHRGIPTLVSW